MNRVILALALLLFSLPAMAGNKVVLSGADHEVTLVSFAVLQQAYARLGYDTEIKIFPSRRALHESASGNTDGEINRVEGMEQTYPDLMRIPVIINSFDSIAFSCGRNFPINGWNSIQDLRIGIMRGIRYAEAATRNMKHVTIEGTYDHLFDLLKLGRLDIVISSRQEAFRQSLRSGGDCIRANEPPLARKELFHYVHKRHADLVAPLAEVLQTMSDNGELESIRNQATREVRARMVDELSQ